MSNTPHHQPPDSQHSHEPEHARTQTSTFVAPARSRELTAALTLVALGIVFGSLGTSPLYALRECFSGPFGVALNQANVYGILSLIFWSLILVVSGKYLLYVTRAHNHGEGGILSLMALAQPHHSLIHTGSRRFLVLLGVVGAGLLFGDSIIVPAISVLAALEGIAVAAPNQTAYIVPLAASILAILFVVQRRGTGRFGYLFGPILLLWFCAIGILGAQAISVHPEILGATHPSHAIRFFQENGKLGFFALGAVFLVVAGSEALYAKMGNFGPAPIRIAWLVVVLPGLLLNYFGQGALLLTNPDAVANPFFHLCPPGALIPMIILATAVAIITAQSLIWGAFSLTSQAIKLGLFPRMQITHTSRDEIGQIYVARINWALLICSIWLIFEFGSSGALAGAFGVAIALTMLTTTVLTFVVTQSAWHWSKSVSLLLTLVFVCMDLAFLGASSFKLLLGAWVPLGVGTFVFVLMTTWRRGRQILGSRLREKLPPFDVFIQEIPELTPLRVPGVAVYMSAQSEFTPPALLYNLRHNKVVHELVVIALVITEEVAYVSPIRRVEVESLGKEIYRVKVHYGYMEQADIPRCLSLCKAHGLEIDVAQATYFFGRESLLATPRPGMAIWREQLFAFLAQNAQKAPRFFRIKADQVIEIGYEVEL